MNSYETVFILTPVLSEEQAKEAVKVYEDYITKNGGTIKHKEFWGLKILRNIFGHEKSITKAGKYENMKSKHFH